MKKLVKIVLFTIGGLIILFLLVAAIVRKDYAVEREITIDKPKAEVFNYLKSLKNQNEWSVWAKLDPKMKTDFRGIDGTVGFVSAWEGNSDVGKGEQEIKEIVEGKRIDFELRFMKPWESTSDAYLITEALSDVQTKVKWGFTGKMPYPMNIMLLFMNMDAAIGKDFEQGLKNLKSKLQ